MPLFIFAFYMAMHGQPMRMETGRATSYEPGDGHCSTMRADGRPFTAEDSHIAHRWLPLGTHGVLCNLRTKLCTVAVVRDRGPFGAIRPCDAGQPPPFTVAGKTFEPRRIRWTRKCYWWQAQPYRLQKGFRYRGNFDLTLSVAKAIDLRSFDEVSFLWLDQDASREKRQRRLRRELRREQLPAPHWTGPVALLH